MIARDGAPFDCVVMLKTNGFRFTVHALGTVWQMQISNEIQNSHQRAYSVIVCGILPPACVANASKAGSFGASSFQ